VVPREDDVLFGDGLAVYLLLLDREVSEPPQDVEEGVPAPDVLPEVTGAVSAGVVGVA
jgi:hypothetical protein